MRTILFLMTLLFAASPLSAWAAKKNILVFGDSLSAGYGIRPEAAWPSLLQSRLSEKRPDYSVANVSISGETTAGGRSRLPGALKQHKPAVVVLELGANDGLRGLQLAQMKENLDAMVKMAQEAGARVLVLGMRLPPNYGPYADQFHESFIDVAKKRKVALTDFFLAPIMDQPALFQPDQLHPTAEAQPKLLDHVWPSLAPLLK
ncbi:MAG TPA: arylesterase [Rhodocyclaceae bacterium]|nr:arylesterase [Rhodocyclaceae bacterium]